VLLGGNVCRRSDVLLDIQADVEFGFRRTVPRRFHTKGNWLTLVLLQQLKTESLDSTGNA
jgi:hypothetical protein